DLPLELVLVGEPVHDPRRPPRPFTEADDLPRLGRRPEPRGGVAGRLSSHALDGASTRPRRLHQRRRPAPAPFPGPGQLDRRLVRARRHAPAAPLPAGAAHPGAGEVDRALRRLLPHYLAGMERLALIAAASFGFLSVALGAFGAHGLKTRLAPLA